MVIDSHQHFWQYDPQRHSWMTQEMVSIQQDFTPELLQEVYQSNGVDGCVAVQADQSEEETHNLLALAKAHSFIKGVVGWVDLRSEAIAERLSYFSDQPVIKGFRHVVQDEPDHHFMLGSEFKRGITALKTHDYTYDILIFAHQLPAAVQLVDLFPNQPFVIDHIAKPVIGDTDNFSFWQKHIKALSAHEQTYCKISGMVTETTWGQWTYEDFEPYMEAVLEAFGPKRLMFGSDWPVCLLSGDYKQVKGIVERFIHTLSKDEQQQIMGGNAASFYGLSI
ncbi:amidohydrolase family protein [Marinoscillum furvescens]|uniref:L-fuconolactonase n=1 Tax=Marinoscillum furvescens DSM 4134 TaxID=1122208 RepID=A0A3D9KYU4_MARFU|nr:amidohydrolase family protein [Marinoscillum furvescens]RED94980.1 L-fuconolactonase [Marinoscillum furvescens DSM 4134]